MPEAITAGKVKLYVNGVSIGCLNNASFTGTTETKVVACAAQEGWEDFIAGLSGWEIQGELYVTDAATGGIAALATIWKDKTITTAKWAIESASPSPVLAWSIEGDALITALSGSAAVGQNDPVTLSVTLKGKGEPTIA